VSIESLSLIDRLYFQKIITQLKNQTKKQKKGCFIISKQAHIKLLKET